MKLALLCMCCMLLPPASGLELVSTLKHCENLTDTALIHIAKFRGRGLITPLMPKHSSLFITAGTFAGMPSSSIQYGPFVWPTPMHMDVTNDINDALQDFVEGFLSSKAAIVVRSMHDAFVRLRVFHSYLNKAVVVLSVLKILCNFSSRLLLFGRSLLQSRE